MSKSKQLIFSVAVIVASSALAAIASFGSSICALIAALAMGVIGYGLGRFDGRPDAAHQSPATSDELTDRIQNADRAIESLRSTGGGGE